MLGDEFVFNMAILFLAIDLMLFFCWFFQPLKKWNENILLMLLSLGKSLSTWVQVYAGNLKCLACGFVFSLHCRDHAGLRSIQMEVERDIDTVFEMKGNLAYMCAHTCRYLSLQMITWEIHYHSIMVAYPYENWVDTVRLYMLQRHLYLSLTHASVVVLWAGDQWSLIFYGFVS